jgi:hypothetical protein
LFDAVGADIDPNVAFANKDVLVEPVGFEELSPKEKPGVEPRFANKEVEEAAGGAAAAEVVAGNKLEPPDGPGREVVVEEPKRPVEVLLVVAPDVAEGFQGCPNKPPPVELFVMG